MNEAKASLKYTMVGAQKARLVADTVRGKSVDVALKTLTYMNKKTAGLIKKLIESAVANAENKKTMNIGRINGFYVSLARIIYLNGHKAVKYVSDTELNWME